MALVLTYKGKWFLPSMLAVANHWTSITTLTVKMFNIPYVMKSNVTAFKYPSKSLSPSKALVHMSPSVFHTDLTWHAACVSGKAILVAGHSVTAPVFDRWPEDIIASTKDSV